MTLTLVGLGLDPRALGDPAREAIAAADATLLESYTSAADVTLDELEAIVGRPVEPLTRAAIEQDDVTIERSKTQNVALLVFGDPMAATTHAELVLRARAAGIPVRILHAASIFSAVGETGLELYRYGPAASLVYPRKNWLPERAAQLIRENRDRKQHTLVLLDIVTGTDEHALLDRDHEAFTGLDTSLLDTDRQSLAGEPQLLMSPNEAVALLLHQNAASQDETLVVCSRLGLESSRVVSGSATSLLVERFGPGPHAIVVPGALHFLEEDFVGSLS